MLAKRVGVLLEWRRQAKADGHPVPSEEDVRRIASIGTIWPNGIDVARAEPWRDTIEFLLTRVALGVDDPCSKLPSRLMNPARPSVPFGPSAPATGSAPAQDDEEVLLTALQKWRAAEQPAHPALEALKDQQLGNIVRTGSRTESAIRRHLPRSLRVFAAKMAEVMEEAVPSKPGAADEPETTGEPESGPGPEPGRSGPAPRADVPTKEGPPGTTTEPAVPLSAPSAASGEPPSAEQRLAELELADYAFGDDTDPTPVAMKIRATGNGIRLTWPAHPAAGTGATVLYRVVSADDAYPPYTPQQADLIGVTTEPSTQDTRPFETAVRHVDVWCHTGSSEQAAAAAEPVLHARGAVVAPVQEPYIGEDGATGVVVAHWTLLPGADAVQVLRVPRAFATGSGMGNPEYRILADEANSSGFVDEGAARGRRFVYQVSVEAEVDGARLLSAPVAVEVAVSAVLAPVTDLTVVQRPGAFDLSWTPPPAGELRLYHSPEAAAAGADEHPLEVSRLPLARLPEEFRLRRPSTAAQGGRQEMKGVPWNPDWNRAYITPVTVLDDMARIGKRVPVVRLDRVEEAVIVERTHEQILTFAWPTGADAVHAFVGPVGVEAGLAIRGLPDEIAFEQYEQLGGLHFRHRLPPRGCWVHVLSVAFGEGRRYTGPPVTIPYRGLKRLRYAAAVQRDPAGRPLAVALQISSEFDDVATYPFALVHNPERLPLHMGDGQPLEAVPTGDPNAVPGAQFQPSRLAADPGTAAWTANVPGLTGFVRLFACPRPEDARYVALLDPAVDDLRLGVAPPPPPAQPTAETRRWGRR